MKWTGMGRTDSHGDILNKVNIKKVFFQRRRSFFY